jgi:DNA-binding NtrC family response regulator
VKSSAILSRGAIVSADELRLPISDRVGPLPGPVEPPRATPEEAAAPASGRAIRTRADWEGAERQRILDALVECNWNKSKAAVLLSVSRRNLYRKLTRYGIEGGTD